MRRSFAALVAVSCAVASPGGTSIAERPIQRALPRVIIETGLGEIEVVQAGIDTARRREGFGRIPLERTSVTGLSHTDGTISMARGGPDTATSDFFICIGDQPSLDFGGSRNADGQGFAAFGKVVRGMEVVRRIQGAPAEGQTLRPPVRIARARRAA